MSRAAIEFVGWDIGRGRILTPGGTIIDMKGGEIMETRTVARATLAAILLSGDRFKERTAPSALEEADELLRRSEDMDAPKPVADAAAGEAAATGTGE